DDTAAPYTWTINSLVAGAHTLRAVATDNQGATAETTVNITVNAATGGNTPPTVAITAPTNGQTFTAGANLTVNATASDANGTVSKVALFYDNVLVNDDTTAPYTWTINSLVAGAHTLRAVATDNQGATAETTVNITVNASTGGGGTGDGSPVVTIIRPTNNQNFPVGTNLTVEATAVDADGSIRNARLLFGGSTVRTITTPPYIWNATTDPALSGLAAGTYEVKVVAVDNQGKTGERIHTITVGGSGGGTTNTPPTVAITAPTNGQTFTAGANLTVNATASDANGTVSKVALFYDNVLVNDDTAAPYTWTINSLVAGAHTLRAVATDNQGATAETTVNITVNAATSNTPPTVAITAPTNGQTFTAGANLTVNATASDANGTVSKVALFYDNVLVNDDTAAPYTWTINSLVAGAHTLRAVATDNQGATAETTVNITVNAATGGNTPPTVAITAPTNGQTFTAGANLTVNATASDANGTVSKVALFYDNVLVNDDTTAPYTWTINSLVAGAHTLRAVATDNQGATAETTVNITVNAATSNTPPTVAITTPANGASFQAGTNLLVQANASDANGTVANVALFYDNQLVSTDATLPYSWTINNVVAGAHTLRAVATDNQGATAETTINITVQGATTGDGKPVVTITTPQDGATFGIGTNLTVKADVVDADGSVRNARLFFDGITVRTITTPPYEWNATTDPLLANLSEGTHEIKVVGVRQSK
ncbi:MAG: hypothetical protein HC892_16400, partial [Saprospiraceae bacterium]|nr:hypothetical protein [Saprospiraceae bacterium]